MNKESENNKRKIQDLLSLAEHFFTIHSYEDAYYLYQKLLGYDELISYHELARKCALCLFRLGRFKEILSPFANMGLSNEDMQFLDDIADQLEDRGFYDEAVEILRFINQNNSLFKEYVQEQRAQMDITLALQQGEFFLRKHRFQDAMRQFQLALKLGYSDYKYLLKEFSQYEDVAEKNAYYWLGKGSVNLKLEQYKEAARCLEKTLTLLGRTARLTVLKKLEDIYRKAIQKMPDDAELYYRVGLFYFHYVKEFAKSQKYFEFLMRDKEYIGIAASYLGLVAYNTKNFNKALEYFEKANLKKEHFDILYSMGEYFEKHEKLYLAYRSYKLIDSIEPDYKKISLKIHTLKLKFKSEELSKYNIPLVKKNTKISPLKGVAAQRYEYISHLGSGGMGNVYKVHDRIQDIVVALKLLAPELRQDNKAIQRFFREAQLASSLNHPYIVKTYDFGFEPRFQQSYITMEYIKGQNLRTIIHKDWELQDELNQEKIDKYLPYIIQLLEALKVSHDKGVIHRDIKPDNILVTSKEKIKVTDFGIACLEFAEEESREHAVGTPKYMSPEQISGKSVDHRTDIYSIGIMMYEMFSGEPPFNIGDIAYQQINVSPLSLRDIYPSMPHHLNSILLKCLQKTPDARFQSAMELLHAIKGNG